MSFTANNVTTGGVGNSPAKSTAYRSAIAAWIGWLGVVLYPFAVTASALTVFGDLSWVIACDVIVCAALIYGSDSRFMTSIVVVIFQAAIFFVFFMPGCRIPVEHANRRQCHQNLKAIQIALDRYHDQHHSLPPAFLADEQGRPQHSWRVLILPFLGYQQVYDAYRFDEPWNGPNNMKLAASVRIKEYACPTTCPPNNTKSKCTNYLAVVGENTAWPGKETRSYAQITDGLSNSIFIIEAEPIENWMEPKDLSAEEAIQFLTSDRSVHTRPSQNRLFGKPNPYPRNVMLGDGSVKEMGSYLRRDFVERLINVADGRPVNPDASREVAVTKRGFPLSALLLFYLFWIIVFVWPCAVWWLGHVIRPRKAEHCAVPTT